MIICGRGNVGLATIGDIEPLHCFWEGISGDLSFANIENPDAAVHASADNFEILWLHLRNWIFKAFYDLYRMIWFTPIVPEPHWRIIRCANLCLSKYYNDVIFWVEANRVDSCCMSCIFPDIFALDNIGEYDIFISSSCDELGVVFADIECVNVIVVDVAVVFYH